MRIELRKATIVDLALLKHWDEQPHVIDSDPNNDWNWEEELDRNPDWREQLIAELNDRPIGFIQIIDPALEESHYWGEIGSGYRALDIWIGEKEDLGKGYGRIMMQLTIDRCFQDERVQTILLDPLSNNTAAHRFYESLGFAFVEERQFHDDHCWVYELKRQRYFANKP